MNVVDSFFSVTESVSPTDDSARLSPIREALEQIRSSADVRVDFTASLQRESFETSLHNWCEEKKGAPEYEKRILAAKRIEQAARTNATRLQLIGLGLTSLPSAIGMLTDLQTLHLSMNQIENIEVLSNLVQLKSLFLNQNLIADIRPLSVLKNLQSLVLYSNRIYDISAIGNLSNLRKLSVQSNRIEEIGPLSLLRDLTELNLAGNKIRNIQPIANLNNLEELDLSYNPISDIEPIDRMAQLDRLNLTSTLIESVPRGLARMKRSSTVDVSKTPLTHHAIKSFQNEIEQVRSQREDLGPDFILPYTTDFPAYDMVADLGFPNEFRPIIARVAHETSPVMGPKTSELINKLGAKAEDFDVTFNDIDPYSFIQEIHAGIQQIRNIQDVGASVPLQLLKLAQGADFPSIKKIQQVADQVMSRCHGLALPGGPDVEREFYDPKADLRSSDYRRTIAEFALADAAMRYRRPIMGTCRGAQLLNVFFGGTLKIAGDMGWGVMDLTNSSKRRRLVELFTEEPLNVYSQHFQSCDRIAPGFEVVMERNQIPKLIMSADDMVIGIQSHPENDENERYSRAVQIYRIFFEKIKVIL